MLVDDLALLVHDVIVLKQLFADLEVVGFDFLLRVGDRPRDHAMFDGHAFFHAQFEHELETRSEAKMRIRSSSRER